MHVIIADAHPVFPQKRSMSVDSQMLIDVSRLLWRSWRGQFPTGIDRACLAYIRHYRDHSLAVVQRGGFTMVLGPTHSRALFELLLDPQRNFRRRSLGFALHALIHSSFDARNFNNALYLNIGHTGLDRSGHGRWVSRTGVRPIYYVHDLIPITHPEYAREGEPERHAARMRTVLEHGKGVIANSRDSIARLAEFAGARGLSMPPVLCAPLGLEDLAVQSTTAPSIAEPYFVVLGTIEGRKNHELLLNVWRRLAERMGERTPKLVVIGQRGWSASDVIMALDSDRALRPHVLELGRCTDVELRTWLVHACALLFPSFVEGQGLPLIEALAMGTPVIASDLAVFRETAGEVPDYRNPRDVRAWLDVILDYALPNSMSRLAQLNRMPGFHPPTWEGHFLAVDRWLDEL